MIFLYNIVGIFFVFKYQQHVIRNEIRRQIKIGLPESELQTIHITASNYKEIIWYEDNEFMYHGMMYDVVHKKVNGLYSITFQCVNDNQESALFSKLEWQVDQVTDTKHHGKYQLKLIMLTFFQKTKNQYLNFALFDFERTSATLHVNPNSQKHVSLQFPPPDLA